MRMLVRHPIPLNQQRRSIREKKKKGRGIIRKKEPVAVEILWKRERIFFRLPC
jgi:hypothetical protein